MKPSNSFASVRNFTQPSESSTDYTTYTPTCEQSTAITDTNNLFLPLQDKSLLLRPLSDTHLVEVYYEAVAMRLSEEFILLIKHAIEQRGLSTAENQSSLIQ